MSAAPGLGQAPLNGRVVVLGGGVAGLTAADELSRRGYAVDLYDAGAALGGRARGVGVRAVAGCHPNLLATMDGIPTGDGTVADRLEVAPSLTVWDPPGTPGPGRRTLRWAAQPADGSRPLDHALHALLGPGPAGAPRDLDVAYLAHLLGVAGLADRRKLAELEGHGFADYACDVFAERSVLRPSTDLRRALRGDGARVLGLAVPGEASARSALVGLVRLLHPIELYTARGERTLPGSAADEWLGPWLADLARPSSHRTRPVRFHTARRVDGLAVRGGRAVSLTLAGGGVVTEFDHVVCTLPHGELRRVLGEPLPACLAGLAHLRDGWTFGARFELEPGRPDRRGLPPGPALHLGTPWALVTHAGPSGALAVTASGTGDRPGGDRLDELWRQLTASVNRDGHETLPADRARVVRAEAVDEVAARLLPAPGSWSHRPAADAGFANLFLAGEHVRTSADVASMESADESGRRAVHALLGADGYHGPAVKIATADHLGLMEES